MAMLSMEQYFFMGAHLWYWLVVTTWLSTSSNRKPSLKTHPRLFYKLCIKGMGRSLLFLFTNDHPPFPRWIFESNYIHLREAYINCHWQSTRQSTGSAVDSTF